MRQERRQRRQEVPRRPGSAPAPSAARTAARNRRRCPRPARPAATAPSGRARPEALARAANRAPKPQQASPARRLQNESYPHRNRFARSLASPSRVARGFSRGSRDMTENTKPVLDFRPRPPASSISAARARRCSTGSMPATRRHVPSAHRGHRPRALDAGSRRRDLQRHGMARARTGTAKLCINSPAPTAIAKLRNSCCATARAYRCYATPARARRDAREAARRRQARPL